jgi:coenzyme PQQ precursor peptide PqqA
MIVSVIDACGRRKNEEETMAWTTPTLVEICIGLEINGYLPAEF